MFPGVLLAGALMASATTVGAQQRWQLTVSPGAAFPTSDFDNAQLDTGYGSDLTISYRFLDHLSGYAGWGWQHFVTRASGDGAEADLEQTGYAFGLVFQHPFGAARSPSWQVRAGGTVKHLELENADGDIIADSGHEVGWEVGVGVSFGLGNRWELIPGIGYRSMNADMDVSGTSTSGTLEYVWATLGVGWSF